MKYINLLTFNYGYGNFTNGPGISCWNFTKFCKKKFIIYSKLESFNLEHKNLYKNYDFNSSDTCHWWSGDIPEFLSIVEYEKKLGKKIILGPNLFDLTNIDRMKHITSICQPDIILVVNKELKYSLSKHTKFPIEDFMTGPDYDIWYPQKIINNKILWKGNSNDLSKDFSMAIHLKKKFVDNMDIYGYPSIYSYPKHIEEASKYYCYVSTSLSETKSEAVLEQMAAGVPTITNLNIFMSGINYKTGLIVDRNLDSYKKAISTILSNPGLRMELAAGARNFILENFKKDDLNNYYNWILNEY